MSISDKTDDIRPNRKRSEADLPPVLRNRKAQRSAEDTAPASADNRVIKLSWADTFGRPSRAEPGRPAPGPAQVLPFQGRRSETAPRSTRRRAADQPPVPVLR